jgi:hypothetical protein
MMMIDTTVTLSERETKEINKPKKTTFIHPKFLESEVATLLSMTCKFHCIKMANEKSSSAITLIYILPIGPMLQEISNLM